MCGKEPAGCRGSAPSGSAPVASGIGVPHQGGSIAADAPGADSSAEHSAARQKTRTQPKRRRIEGPPWLRTARVGPSTATRALAESYSRARPDVKAADETGGWVLAIPRWRDLSGDDQQHTDPQPNLFLSTPTTKPHGINEPVSGGSSQVGGAARAGPDVRAHDDHDVPVARRWAACGERAACL